MGGIGGTILGGWAESCTKLVSLKVVGVVVVVVDVEVVVVLAG